MRSQLGSVSCSCRDVRSLRLCRGPEMHRHKPETRLIDITVTLPVCNVASLKLEGAARRPRRRRRSRTRGTTNLSAPSSDGSPGGHAGASGLRDAYTARWERVATRTCMHARRRPCATTFGRGDRDRDRRVHHGWPRAPICMAIALDFKYSRRAYSRVGQVN
jgi:hypothetical protein